MSHKYYQISHTVTFEETNALGNVYFTRHLQWQGKCREHFLQEHAPETLEELKKDLSLVTSHVSCDYFVELFAFDKILIRMRLGDYSQNRLTLEFEIVRVDDGQTVVVAQGKQEILCMRRVENKLIPSETPESLRAALEPFH